MTYTRVDMYIRMDVCKRTNAVGPSSKIKLKEKEKNKKRKKRKKERNIIFGGYTAILLCFLFFFFLVYDIIIMKYSNTSKDLYAYTYICISGCVCECE